MFKSFQKWLDDNRDYGFTLWYAYDPVTQKASITLFMAYVSFIVAIGAGIYSVFKPSALLGTVALMAFSVTFAILYMIRSLNKAKFNLKEQQFELETNEEKEKK